ncbi:unnamed protein product [Chilo suppressalis]|uniref:Microtubule-associated protein Jupiter n=1 Tax=Chilo suppressalis TaxID=168631 RepID=A0ABN8B0C8_CHISP|nr:hypothetical protein evm_014202 [Chilo suppressalis]CAH0402296.1 unnamed protein product [Chilo suppressalis]
MTSTQFNVGLTDNTRLSSRVLRPPGGGHTDIFGGEPEPQRGRRPAPSVIAAQQAEQQKLMESRNGTEEATQNGQVSPPEQQASQPQQQAAQPEQQAAEPQTPPEPKCEEKVECHKVESPQTQVPQQEPVKVEAPRRVRVPPGGFSSGLW